MSLGRKVLSGLLLLCAFTLLGPASALASGNGCSAGDNQYVDPLGGNCNNTPGSHHHHSGGGSGGGGGSSTGTSGSTGTSTTASGGTTASTTTSSSTGSHSSSGDPKGKTLPFTGLDLWACLALGIGLIGSGAALRRTIRLPRAE